MSGSQTPSSLSFRSVSLTHSGCRRTVNEDRILDRPDLGFWAVADGMGGHEGGDVAASRLVEALACIDHRSSGYTRLTDIVREVDKVNSALFERDAGLGPVAGGSTVVTLLAHDGHYACLWAGDSRAYLLRAGKLAPITRDHSIVQQLVDGGIVGESERRSHPSSHVVTRAVGATPQVELERRFAPIETGDIFLLCSDGLTACLEDREIAQFLEDGDPDRSAHRMLDLALNRQAQDNVSLIVVVADGARARAPSHS
jgi:serine/threonine protein phosphatase PrpC